MRNKKLTDFSDESALKMDRLLYFINNCGNIKYGKIKESHLYTSKADKILLRYLLNQGYCELVNKGEIVSGSDVDYTYYITPKGKIICEQGGIQLLWENNRSRNSSKRISIVSAIIAVLALITNILFAYFK